MSKYQIVTRTSEHDPEQPYGMQLDRLDFATFAARTVSRRGGFYTAVLDVTPGDTVDIERNEIVPGGSAYPVAVYRNGAEVTNAYALEYLLTGTCAQVVSIEGPGELLDIARVADQARHRAREIAIRAALAGDWTWAAIGERLDMTGTGAKKAAERYAGKRQPVADVA